MGKPSHRKTAKLERSKADRAVVKDLAPRTTSEVKGGQTTTLMKTCASGQHIKEATITV